MRWIAPVCIAFVMLGVAAAEEPMPPTCDEILPEAIARPAADGGPTAQIQHLFAAAKHLAAAGKHDDAARWRAEADRARRQLLAQKLDDLAHLQAEIEQLRGDLSAPQQVCLECKLIAFSSKAIAKLDLLGADESPLAQILKGELPQPAPTGVVDAAAPALKVLEALCQRGLVNVIAEPKLITVGERAAVFQIARPLAGIGQPETSLRFECLPQQGTGGKIRLGVKLRLGGLRLPRQPTIREIETGEDLRPGQTFVIGGFVDQDEVAPLRGHADIEPGPNANDANAETEILVLVKPTTVAPTAGRHADRRADPASFYLRDYSKD